MEGTRATMKAKEGRKKGSQGRKEGRKEGRKPRIEGRNIVKKEAKRGEDERMERMKEAKAGKEGSQGRKKNDISRRAKEGNRKGGKEGRWRFINLLKKMSI